MTIPFATMPKIAPSQIVEAIDEFFGPSRQQIDNRAVGHFKRAEVHALLSLLDEVPRELIDLPVREYLEFNRCWGVLATALAMWNVGDIMPAKAVGGNDPVERIRRLMGQCRDELPSPEPELPFITDVDTRLGIEDRIHAAWIDFNAREWMGATVFAGGALEALLLWALKRPGALDQTEPTKRKRSFDEMFLAELIDSAAKDGLISPETRAQAVLAKDARNLMHPGKVMRSGAACSKSTALTGLAGLYRVIQDLAKLPSTT